MTSLINKIELLIKREKASPERKKKDDSTKSSSEILSELFSAFNADPPKIEEVSLKKSKKSKKKHKKDKKKRSRSSSSSDSESSDYSRKRKKRKKSKSKKRRRSSDGSPSISRSSTPPKIKPDPSLTKVKHEHKSIKVENLKTETGKHKVKTEPKEEKQRVSLKVKDHNQVNVTIDTFDTSQIPLPDDSGLDCNDLRLKLDKKVESNGDNDKSKGKIQIKNLKFSTVFEETVKKAEEEARKRKEKTEEGEYTDSSSSSVKEEPSNSHFPKSSDPGGILKKQAAEIKIIEDDRSQSRKSKEKSNKSSKRERDRSRSRRRSRSGSSRRRQRSGSRRRSRSPHGSRSRHRSSGRRSRSRERERHRVRHVSPRHRGRRSRSPTGVRLADSEKKRLLEVARRNAINMLKNGAVPAGAAALPPHTRSQVMAAIQSGGKSVDELTDFCKHLSKKEALGELSSVASSDEDMSENEDTLAFHHPFLVKEKAPIVMNIRGGAPLPVKSSILPVANKDELRLQFPVSSGSQHREKASEWVPVSPKKDSDKKGFKVISNGKGQNIVVDKIPIKAKTQIAKLSSKPVKTTPAAITPAPSEKAAPLALPAPPLPAPPPLPAALALPAPPPAALALPAPPVTTTASQPPYMKSFTTGSQLSTTPTAPPRPAPLAVAATPALPAPGPQAYPPGIEPPKIDISAIVSEKLLMIRKSQEQNELTATRGFGWSARDQKSLGQFTGSTGAQILTPRELASGTQAWAKKEETEFSQGDVISIVDEDEIDILEEELKRILGENTEDVLRDDLKHISKNNSIHISNEDSKEIFEKDPQHILALNNIPQEPKKISHDIAKNILEDAKIILQGTSKDISQKDANTISHEDEKNEAKEETEIPCRKVKPFSVWDTLDQLQRAAPVEGGMGMHLLQKMGWTPGRGLGKEGTGALQPLLLEVKLDTRGLQAKEEVQGRHGKGIKQRGNQNRRGAASASGGGPAPLVAGGKHPVSLLGEYCSKHKLGPPEYNLCFECGPDHKKNFLFKVKVAGTEYQPAVASANKKQAKADAAQLALQKLGIVTA